MLYTGTTYLHRYSMTLPQSNHTALIGGISTFTLAGLQSCGIQMGSHIHILGAHLSIRHHTYILCHSTYNVPTLTTMSSTWSTLNQHHCNIPLKGTSQGLYSAWQNLHLCSSSLQGTFPSSMWDTTSTKWYFSFEVATLNAHHRHGVGFTLLLPSCPCFIYPSP